MIQSFQHKGLENFYRNGNKKGIQPKHSDRLSDILDILDAAEKITDIAFPGSRLHPLHPKNQNIWSVKVSGAWRITFRFVDGDAFDLDYVNYH